MKETYIVIKKLPDADIGTEVIWVNDGCYRYKKSQPYLAYAELTQAQVVNSTEFFAPADKYPEYYAYNEPTYNRREILDLVMQVKQVKSGKSLTTAWHNFEKDLRELGNANAEKILKNK
jgi:hypothetical protein